MLNWESKRAPRLFSLFVSPCPPGIDHPGEAGTLTKTNSAGRDDGEYGMVETAEAVQPDRADEPDQLQLRFFAVVGGMHSAPPERALWRELLDLAIGKAKTLSAPDGRVVSASAAWAVGAAVYFRANSRGVVEGFSHDMLAADCRLDPRTARSALKVLAFLRIVVFKAGPRRSQRGPRPRALHMNLGGLDWPAVRRRAKREQTEQTDLLPRNTGHGALYLDGNTGRGARQFDGNTGHHARLQRADPRRANPAVVANLPPPPHERNDAEQQQLNHKLENRIEGLIGAIAARARKLGMLYDENDERRRLASGEIGIAELQALADELGERIRVRRRL